MLALRHAPAIPRPGSARTISLYQPRSGEADENPGGHGCGPADLQAGDRPGAGHADRGQRGDRNGAPGLEPSLAQLNWKARW